MTASLVIDSRLTIPASDLSWSAVRASGPGGQNVNKVSSKVVLRFDIAGSAVLDTRQKSVFLALPGVRLDADGAVVVASQVTRDQVRNLEDARQKLRELVLRAVAPPPRPRKPTKPSRRAKARRVDDKKRRGAIKQGRGRPTDD